MVCATSPAPTAFSARSSQVTVPGGGEKSILWEGQTGHRWIGGICLCVFLLLISWVLVSFLLGKGWFYGRFPEFVEKQHLS